MIAVAFDEDNLVLHPPDGVDPDDCSALSAFRGFDENGNLVVITCWKPSVDEIEEIKRTGRVWLIIWGPTMQPAALSGLSPFLPFAEEIE